MSASEMPDIPVVDFDTCGLHVKDVTKEALLDVGTKIKDAFHSTGFCYLKNHGIDQEVLENYFKTFRQFFDLPVVEKQKIVKPKDTFHGWVSVEMETLNLERPGDLKECFNFHPADTSGTWPLPEIKTAMESEFELFTKLSLRVLDSLSVGLELGETFLRDAHKFIGQKCNQTTLRNLYYPPLREDMNIKPGQIRLGEHSDYSCITMLYQDSIGGLEVNIPGKGFVPATPIPGTILINIGDLMQRWTADKLIATKHRVLIPEAETKKRTPRQSVAFFLLPDDDYLVKCLDGSDKYEPVKSYDYLAYKFSITY